MKTLDRYRKNEFSQYGEDGVIAELASRLQITRGQFVEFGAWDGRHLSNTFALLSKEWRGVHIEGDAKKYEALLATRAKYPDQLHTICAYVMPEGENTLDRLLAATHIPRDFDLLSIDIDSFDWHVWLSFKNYSPKIVIIETNNNVPPGIEQTHRGSIVQGSSFTSTIQLGKTKGYQLVCHTGNCIFVRDDLVGAIGLAPEEVEFPEQLFDYSQCLITMLFSYHVMQKLRWLRPFVRLMRRSVGFRPKSMA